MNAATTRYLADALRLDTLVAVAFPENAPHVVLPRAKVEAGTLPPDVTKRLFRASKSAPRARGTRRSIGVVISLVSIREDESAPAAGLLNVPATLAADGTLAFNPDRDRPWIPRERLSTPNGETLDVMAGTLEDYWRFEREEAETIRSRLAPDDWQGYLDYAAALFEHVAHDVAAQASSAGYEYRDRTCRIKPFDNANANDPIIDAYQSILDCNADLPLYSRMIGIDPHPSQRSINADGVDAGDQLLKNTLATCGNMSCKFPLANSQRRAVHAFQATGNGEVLAVSGPPGTGKTTMLQSIVASLVVRHALDGKDAPVIVGTSTNNQAVTNIIESFSGVAPEQHGALDFRWLPKATEGSAGDEPLASIAAFCPASTKLDDYEKQGLLCEQRNRSRAYADYSTEAYVAAATERMLACAKRCLGFAPISVDELQETLLERLREVDEARRRALEDCDAYFSAAVAAATAGPRKAPRFEQAGLAAIEAMRAAVQQRLESWRAIAPTPADDPRGFFPTLANELFEQPENERALIAEHREPDETIPADAATIADVIAYYKGKIAHLESTERQLRAKAGRHESEQRSPEELRGRFEHSLGQVADLCAAAPYAGPDAPDYAIPNHSAAGAVDPREQLLALDRALDITLRYIEFWLAIHYYECAWLITCANGEILDKGERTRTTPRIQRRYWSQAPSLTPCFVMTEYQIPKYFSIYRKGQAGHDFGRIDLLITDEAGQVNTPVALASFALAKKAVVVGDTHQLAPVWTLDEETDRHVAKHAGMPEELWDAQKAAGLTCSQPSSLMKAAAHACAWRYSEEEAGLFLEEHYRCVEGIVSFCNTLIYRGRLVPSRANPSTLAGEAEPFLFKQVSGSRDERVGSSRRNAAEAEAIVEWIAANRTYLENRYGKGIDKVLGVVTPFKAQASLIRKTLEERDPNLAVGITVGTAHRLQGAERPVVIFSATYGENSDDAAFVNGNPELMNVAVSRAKDLFIVFGAKKRRTDSGTVFAALNSHAPLDDCTFGQNADSAVDQIAVCADEDVPDRESAWVDPKQAPYVPISAFLAQLREDGRIAGKMPTARQANKTLADSGLLQRLVYRATGNECWFPTARGLECGIRIAHGGASDKAYAYPVYADACADAVSDALNDAQ